MSGAWVADDAQGRTEEHWILPSGSMMLGVNRTVASGKTVHYEQLRIERRADGIFYVSSPVRQATTEFRLVKSDRMRAVFENPAHDFPKRISYWRDEGGLHARVEGAPGERTAEWLFRRAVLDTALAALKTGPELQAPPDTARLFEADLVFDVDWQKGDAAKLGFDEAALASIVHDAEASGSDTLLVIKDGRVVVERYFGKPHGPIETMSATKSVVSIAIGMLIADKKIPSLDAPLSTWFPEWRQGKKAKVTLRHVLTHTSGLEHRKGARVLNEQRDRLTFVRQAPIVEEPGANFSYSNEAVQLLAGVVSAAAGKPLDAYVAEKLFGPLGITEWQWAKDGAGNVQTFFGLALGARDFARIGQLMLASGSWKGKQLLTADWVTTSTSVAVPGSGHGLLWWIRSDGPTSGPIGYAADGWLGQQLIVFPERGVVAVRQHREPKNEMADEAYNKKHGFFDLYRRLYRALR
jgi:CubicO group peptidase (beta-lactamase class C family)